MSGGTIESACIHQDKADARRTTDARRQETLAHVLKSSREALRAFWDKGAKVAGLCPEPAAADT